MKGSVQFSLPAFLGWRVVIIRGEGDRPDGVRDRPASDLRSNCVDAVRRVVEAASELGKRTLTRVVAFSDQSLYSEIETPAAPRSTHGRRTPQTSAGAHQQPQPLAKEPANDYWLR